MSQLSFAPFDYAAKKKRAKREKFLSEMDRVVPWDPAARVERTLLSAGLAGAP